MGPIHALGNLVTLKFLRNKGGENEEDVKHMIQEYMESKGMAGVNSSDHLDLLGAGLQGNPEASMKGGNLWLTRDKYAVYEVNELDKGTPDEWVQRHPELIRLTGRHPFNVEPPLPLLMEAGFITPASIHYVRNHGPPPKIDWDTHRIVFCGNAPKKVFKMDDIVNMPRKSLPVLLVCAGNRRKEQNMLKQTIGFNWGAAGLGNSVWTGVPLHVFLKRCGVTQVTENRQFLCFKGPNGELPKGSDGSYGTSIPLSMALDPGNDCMLAYQQNGAPLHPDHGYPIRIIIPGWIGGRMVKWLSEISVTKEPSDNFYHFNDNRILPPNVDAERATKEGWWYKEEYIFNQLNINSAISSPAHDDELEHDEDFDRPYNVRGYAYTGGGRKITRVEFSLDGGVTWRLTSLHVPEKETEHGKYWCWIFWKVELTTRELSRATQLVCRAWDENNNTQPKDITWNVMGMGNSCYFRIKIHKKVENGCVVMRFEHPTLAGPNKGGWMGSTPGGWKHNVMELDGKIVQKKAELKPAVSTKVTPSVVKSTAFVPGGGRVISMAEVEKHDQEDDVWIVVAGKVYDCTKYLSLHPGGADSITINAGTDCTEEFEAIHSKKAWKLLDEWYIGDLEGAAGQAEKKAELFPQPAPAVPSTQLIALDPKKRQAFKLQEKIIVNHNTRVFRFALQSPQHIFGLPIGKHVLISNNIGGKMVMRAYTPKGDGPGYFDLLIKVYFANVHPRFPEGGVFSQHLDVLEIGDTVDVKGPIGHVLYEGKGHYKVNKDSFHAKKIGMMAGGTGITPMWQVIVDICNNPEDNTEVSLIFANNSWDDLLLYDELEEMQKKHPQLHVWHTLATPPNDGSWKYSQGFISEDMIRDHLPAPGDDVSIYLCGPPPMLEFACMPNLKKLGHNMDRVVAF